ncbi:hypothetical protein N7510_008875 [Penicillium lagena]|uniref:uncharacterized protein n=1 Tax=Penicillium lagena TaxID=94218 RepID=UPI002541EC4F|nr:uncharacterized protein N7510_008875 [Penicillium lagena]KAJ5606094.1 hypothetical protein N7510_008875 [Penicillium lagena]
MDHRHGHRGWERSSVEENRSTAGVAETSSRLLPGGTGSNPTDPSDENIPLPVFISGDGGEIPVHPYYQE